MVQRKLLILALVLLLLPVGIGVAQSSSNFVMQRFAMIGGGSADSANYMVTSVIGQPVTAVVDSSDYQVSAGFLIPRQRDSVLEEKIWLPMIFK